MPTISSTELPSTAQIREIEDHIGQVVSDFDAVVTALKRRAATPEYGKLALNAYGYGLLRFIAADAKQVADVMLEHAERIDELAYEVFAGERANHA